MNKIAKWKSFRERRESRNALISIHLRDFQKPVKHGKITFTPDEKEVAKFKKILESCTDKELQQVGVFNHYDLKLDVGDRLKSLNKKKYAVVTIFNDNKTTDTGVCQTYSRTFSREGMTYIVMSERGIYDPEFKMTHFYYYANNPFPIAFQKNHDPEAIADAKLLDDTIEMKVVEALANTDMSRTIVFVLLLTVLTVGLGIANIVIQLKAQT